MPFRILVVARWYPSHEVPGRGSFVADQVAALRDAGAQVVVICPEPVYVDGLDGPARTARLAQIERWAAVIGSRRAFAAPAGRGAPGVPVLRIPAPLPAGGDATRDPVVLASLEAAALVPVGTALHAAWPFDVIHAHTGLPDGLAAAALSDAVRVPLLTTEHDSAAPAKVADPAAAAEYRGLMGPGRTVVAVSRALAGRIEERLGLERGRIAVVPNVLPVSTFRMRTDWIRRRNELLWVGSRKESKGTDTLLRAVALVRRERRRIRLRLIGRAPTAAEEARLVALAADLGITKAVRFEAPTDRAGVAAAMARATLFVHPSPWETFGVVAAEALAMGLPVVATPSGGVEEIIGPDGRFGTVARDGEPESLAAAILTTLDRRAEFKPAELRAHVSGRYAPEVVAAELLARFAALGATASAAGPERPEAGGSTPPRLVIVGFRRASAIARIPALPAGLLAGLTVVTSAPVNPLTGAPSGDPPPPLAVRDWTDVDVGRAFRTGLAAAGESPARRSGRWRTLLHPVRAIRRRRLWAAQADLFAAARHAAIGDAIARVRTSSSEGPVTLLPLDIDDLESIGPFLAGGNAVLAPGTLGWLVDRWATHQR
jgi:glycosyltransferase involved in cell wall biosynthesis